MYAEEQSWSGGLSKVANKIINKQKEVKLIQQKRQGFPTFSKSLMTMFH